MRYLLDTSVCISIIRGKASANALPPLDTCGVSVITAAELEVGVHRSTQPEKQRRSVDNFLLSLEVYALGSTVVSHYGEIRADLERKGTIIGPLDLLIAAHAVSLGAGIITGNVGEFRRVKGLKVLAWK